MKILHRMPGILKTVELRGGEEEGEREGDETEGVTERKDTACVSNGGRKREEEKAGEEREGSCTPCSSPDAAGKQAGMP